MLRTALRKFGRLSGHKQALAVVLAVLAAALVIAALLRSRGRTARTSFTSYEEGDCKGQECCKKLKDWEKYRKQAERCNRIKTGDGAADKEGPKTKWFDPKRPNNADGTPKCFNYNFCKGVVTCGRCFAGDELGGFLGEMSKLAECASRNPAKWYDPKQRRCMNASQCKGTVERGQCKPAGSGSGSGGSGSGGSGGSGEPNYTGWVGMSTVGEYKTWGCQKGGHIKTLRFTYDRDKNDKINTIEGNCSDDTPNKDGLIGSLAKKPILRTFWQDAGFTSVAGVSDGDNVLALGTGTDLFGNTAGTKKTLTCAPGTLIRGFEARTSSEGIRGVRFVCK